ncbi:inositol monophosphatase family protein [Roseinatronobacter sp. NSM]|uniref:inositol monophosphatase family protein n=1 Tax=Roseinatronobacter sp. NSM TaxID=3457785 RepID=UPI004037280A
MTRPPSLIPPQVQNAAYGHELAPVLSAMTRAGDGLLDFWSNRGSLEVAEKRAGDFVSAADRQTEDMLRDALCRPGDHWLGEETHSPRPPAQDGARVWIVDPLDGTTNFLRGIGHWAISVALQVDGVRVLGVIHDPLRRETFYAVRGAGAFLNGVPIRAAATPRLQDALFGTGIPFGQMAHIDDHTIEIARLMPLCAGVRRMGAAALDLAYVACGRLDGFWERRLQPWDIAAGLVLAQEAGVRVEALDRAEMPEATGTVLAACAPLFDPFAAVLRGAHSG